MAQSTGSRHPPARSQEAAAAAGGHRPKTAPFAVSAAPPSQLGSSATRAPAQSREDDMISTERTARHAPPSADVDALLEHPLVRDLIRESESMLMELAVLREAHAHRHVSEERQFISEEKAARASLYADEARARVGCAAVAQSRLARRVVSVERVLADEEAENEKLRSFAELAQAQLDSRPHAEGVKATTESAASSSPPIKARRGDGGSGATDGDGDSRRQSLEEITNLRGSVKRLRSVESSESGTPRDRRHRLSGTQRSPGALTKVRKTMQ